MKIEHEIQKLKDMEAKRLMEIEDAKREERLMEQLSKVKVLSTENNPSNPAAPSNPDNEKREQVRKDEKAEKREDNVREADEWSVEEVGVWVGKLLGKEYEKIFLTNKVDGKKLLELTTKEIQSQLKVRGL